MILLAAATQAGVAAGRLGGGGALDIPVARIIVSLIACLLIAALAIVFLRQRAGKADLRALFGRLTSGHGAIDIVEVRRLGMHGDVCLIRHDDREYLLLVQNSRAIVLRERDIPARVEEA
ncbi:hypothetical protein [Sphingomonas sp. DT-204]|uniref:hypothetical protein n=1 Tax=Sphingomonas sp. DT-204 TaxID=3396166 RepID=UPI003F1CBF3A